MLSYSALATYTLQHHQGCLGTPKCAYVIYGQPLREYAVKNCILSVLGFEAKFFYLFVRYNYLFIYYDF